MVVVSSATQVQMQTLQDSERSKLEDLSSPVENMNSNEQNTGVSESNKEYENKDDQAKMISLSKCEGFNEFLKAIAIISGEEVAPVKNEEKK